MLGRTYVHSTVYSIILDAYQALELSAANKHFVYGETGKKKMEASSRRTKRTKTACL
jgi:hypothetical protein